MAKYSILIPFTFLLQKAAIFLFYQIFSSVLNILIDSSIEVI